MLGTTWHKVSCALQPLFEQGLKVGQGLKVRVQQSVNVQSTCRYLQFRGKLRGFFNTKTARKWHIDCMESQDSPALRNKGVKVVHVKQRKAGRILFKKTEITRFHPTDVF